METGLFTRDRSQAACKRMAIYLMTELGGEVRAERLFSRLLCVRVFCFCVCVCAAVCERPSLLSFSSLSFSEC